MYIVTIYKPSSYVELVRSHSLYVWYHFRSFQWTESPFWKYNYQLLTVIAFSFSREVHRIDEVRIFLSSNSCCTLLIFAWCDQISLMHFYIHFVEYSLVQKCSALWHWNSSSLINVWICEAWNLSFGIDLCVNLSQNSVSFKHHGARFSAWPHFYWYGYVFVSTNCYFRPQESTKWPLHLPWGNSRCKKHFYTKIFITLPSSVCTGRRNGEIMLLAGSE